MSTTTERIPTDAPELSDDQLDHAVHAVVAELVAKFPHASEADVAALVSASAASFAGARITEFIPVLIGQEVDRQLRATTPRLAS
ncbi:MAG: hypothetical protein ABI720_05250 [Actinomycetes bacterium]